jgi:hypothetical protein
METMPVAMTIAKYAGCSLARALVFAGGSVSTAAGAVVIGAPRRKNSRTIPG